MFLQVSYLKGGLLMSLGHDLCISEGRKYRNYKSGKVIMTEFCYISHVTLLYQETIFYAMAVFAFLMSEAHPSYVNFQMPE